MVKSFIYLLNVQTSDKDQRSIDHSMIIGYSNFSQKFGSYCLFENKFKFLV